MTKQELVQKLRDLIAKGEIKKNIEDKAGLSRNSLAGAMNNPDKMGKPMFEKLAKWVDQQTFEKRVGAREVIRNKEITDLERRLAKEDNKASYERAINEFNSTPITIRQEPWISIVRDYCESQSMTPEELVAFHKAMIRPKKENKSPATVTVTPKTESSSMSFMERRRKLKNGQ